jgi:hypothetical protein
VDTQALLNEIETQLPVVPKPPPELIGFHPTGCGHCDLLREDLEKYPEPTLPDEAIRYLHNDWSCLSPQATRWVLPSYLRRCITMDTYDSLEVEFLICSLSPEAEYESETRQRLNGLSANQTTVLLHFLEWCAEHPEWSSYCEGDIGRAIVFVQSLIDDKRRPNKSLERTREG